MGSSKVQEASLLVLNRQGTKQSLAVHFNLPDNSLYKRHILIKKSGLSSSQQWERREAHRKHSQNSSRTPLSSGPSCSCGDFLTALPETMISGLYPPCRSSLGCSDSWTMSFLLMIIPVNITSSLTQLPNSSLPHLIFCYCKLNTQEVPRKVAVGARTTRRP